MSKPNMMLLIVMSVLIVAGQAGADDRPPGTLDQLLGTWEWTTATGGFVGGVYGPDDWGYTSQLLFLADGAVIEFRDETPYAQSVFVLTGEGPGATLGAQPSTPSVTPFGDCGPYLLTFGEEGGVATMYLQTQSCADWYDFTFTRRGPVPNTSTSWSGIKSLYR